MRQAAKAPGQRGKTTEPASANLNLTIERLNAGRRRAREHNEKTQALNAGAQTAV